MMRSRQKLYPEPPQHALPDARLTETPQVLAADLGRSFPQIQKITLFGSRARGDAATRADVDLALHGVTAADMTAILGYVEAYPSLLKLDVLRYEEVDNEFKANIDRDGMVLYERN